MKLRYKEELDKAVDLVLAVFHLDIEMCTEVLLTFVLPQYLHNIILYVLYCINYLLYNHINSIIMFYNSVIA